MGFLWFILGSLIIITLAARVLLRRWREVRNLQDLARAARLNFSSEDIIGIQERFQNLDLIRRGHGRHVSNVLYGSTDAGLTTLFCYTYDLGFGVHQMSDRWWFVVVETEAVHDHWRAAPAAPSENTTAHPAGGAMQPAHGPDPLHEMQVGSLRVIADHEHTLQRLTAGNPRRFLESSPATYHWEARGPFLAAATPLDMDPDAPRHLLTAAHELANLLAHPAAKAGD